MAEKYPEGKINHQSKNRQTNRPDDSAVGAVPSGQGDQVMAEKQAAMPGLN